MTLAISATLMQTPERDRLEVRDALVVIDGDGLIIEIHPRGSAAAEEAASAADT